MGDTVRDDRALGVCDQESIPHSARECIQEHELFPREPNVWRPLPAPNGTAAREAWGTCNNFAHDFPPQEWHPENPTCIDWRKGGETKRTLATALRDRDDRIAAALALHEPSKTFCKECHILAPCPTRRTLEGGGESCM